MTGAADDHPPIAPPDTRPVPSGWVMLAEAFTSVANIVDDPEEAAYELRRATSINRDEDDQPSKGGVLQELRSIAPIGVSWPQLQGKSTRPGNKQ